MNEESREARHETSLGRYDTSAPLLLATDYPSSAGGGGAVLLRSLLRGEDRQRVLWASTSPTKPANAMDASLTGGSGSPDLDALLAGRIASELRVLAKRRNARAFWIVMHGSMVHVAARLLSDPTLPVHLTVHDDPFGLGLMSYRRLPLLPLIARDFRFALRRARSIDVISAGMADRYRRLLGVEAIVVHRGMEPPPEETSQPPLDPALIEIGVLGNTYGYAQLALLARALKVAIARVQCRGRITIIGQGLGERLRAEHGDGLDIQVTGHLNEGEGVDRLRRCFALYLNYPFSRRTGIFRTTSFPTKLSTYLLAERPLVVHSPVDSSLSPLRSLSGYVEWWDNNDADAGAASILGLWNNPAARHNQRANAEALRRRYYDLATNQRALFGCLNSLV
jgi:hypothetical protein